MSSFTGECLSSDVTACWWHLEQGSVGSVWNEDYKWDWCSGRSVYLLLVSQCLYKHTWRSLASWNVPQKWLCYSRQNHGIVHLNCRAHTAMTEFWVMGIGAGCWHWYSKTVGSRKARGWKALVQLLLLLPKRHARLWTILFHSKPSACASFWLFGCVKIEHRLAHIRQAFYLTFFPVL